MARFDEERSCLDNAYTTDETFSCSIHEPSLTGKSTGTAELVCCQPPSVQGYGRPQVVQRCKNVVNSPVYLGPYLLSCDDSRRPFHDVAILAMPSPAGSMSRDVVLLMIHGDAVHVNAETGNDQALSVIRRSFCVGLRTWRTGRR
jgi:hypothetical protein